MMSHTKASRLQKNNQVVLRSCTCPECPPSEFIIIVPLFSSLARLDLPFPQNQATNTGHVIIPCGLPYHGSLVVESGANS